MQDNLFHNQDIQIRGDTAHPGLHQVQQFFFALFHHLNGNGGHLRGIVGTMEVEELMEDFGFDVDTASKIAHAAAAPSRPTPAPALRPVAAGLSALDKALAVIALIASISGLAAAVYLAFLFKDATGS